MLTASVKFSHLLRLDSSVVVRSTENLADRLAQIMIAQNQIALLGFGAKATGGTLRSIRVGLAVRTATYQRRQITAGGGYKFIVSGRKPGGKMPVRVVPGVTKRGGLRFEPLPAMLTWFLHLGIPREAWFPIMRSIARKGIKPRDIPGKALRAARGQINTAVRQTATQIGRQILFSR